jgi:manganese efflux pump family protein
MLALLLVAGSLGLSNFAASIAIGLSGVDRATRARVAASFGLFEAGMPVIGLLIGQRVSHALGAQADIAGGLLLIGVGVHAILSHAGSSRESPSAWDGARFGRLLVLAAGLSIDNLVVASRSAPTTRRSFSASQSSRVVSVGLSLVGLELGSRLGRGVEHRSELIAGAVLICVGLAILLSAL